MIMKYDFSKSDYLARFQDYAAHRCSKNGSFDTTMSLDAKKQRLDNYEFFQEVERISGMKRGENDISINAWMSSPTVQWAAFSLIDRQVQIIVKLLDNSVLDSLVDVQTAQNGDAVRVKVSPGYRYTVSAAAGSERFTNRARKFDSEILISPTQKQVTTFEKFFNILAGKASICDVSFQVAESFKLAKMKDVFETLRKHIETTSVSFRGTATARDILEACSYITQINGAQSKIIGTAAAIAQLPGKLGSNYRVNIDGTDAPRVGLMSQFYGTDVVVMPDTLVSYDPKANGSFWANTAALDAEFDGSISIGSTVGPQDYLWIMSDTNVKPVMLVEGSEESNTYDYKQFSDLSNVLTFSQAWGCGAVSPYQTAVVKLS